MISTILTIILWTCIGGLTSYFAYQRGRDPYIWFAIGIFFGILGMIVLFLLPPAQSEEEAQADQKNQEVIEKRTKQIQEEERQEQSPDLYPQSIETKEWFYLDQARQTLGPFSFYIVHELWDGGDITANTLVWTEGMEEWKRVKEVPNLQQALEDAEDRKKLPEDI